MIMVLLNVSEGQILVKVCLRFIDVQGNLACWFKRNFKKDQLLARPRIGISSYFNAFDVCASPVALGS